MINQCLIKQVVLPKKVIDMTLLTIKWLDQAACLGQGLNLFYFENLSTTETRKTVAKAKMICKSCPVVADCLQYAINNEERFGVWGSFSSKERAAIVNYFNLKEITIEESNKLVNQTILQLKRSVRDKEFIKNNDVR